MMAGLSRSAAACSAATSSTARKALSFLRKPISARFSSCSMKEWPLSQYVAWNGKKPGYTDNDRSQNFIADVEVVMGEAAPLLCQNSVIRILGGILRDGDAEGAALFHAFEEEVNPVSVGLLHPVQSG